MALVLTVNSKAGRSALGMPLPGSAARLGEADVEPLGQESPCWQARPFLRASLPLFPFL